MLTKEQNKVHYNKIFSVKHSTVNPNQIYSGSWDMNVKVWDIRAGKTSHIINGIQTCGDSIDMDSDGTTLVTGGGTSGEGI
jgi:WD40 repeat protein